MISWSDIPQKWLVLFRDYSPLIFTVFYFIHPIVEPPRFSILFLLILVYFVNIYLYHLMVNSTSKSRTFLSILLSLVLGAWASEYNQSAYAFHWFCAYFAALRFPLTPALLTLTIILSSLFLNSFLLGYHHLGHYLSVCIPSVGLFFYGFYDQLERKHQQAQAKTQQEIKQLAQVAERERIARDLHDVMGHSLITISLKAQLADKLAKNGQVEKALQEIAEVASVSSETLSQMRSVISGYKAKSLDSLITKLIESLEKWNFEVETDLLFPELTARQESTLSLVLTEAITNIIKHCQGSKVSLKTENPAKDQNIALWALHIQDNGKLDRVMKGNGLNGIRERLAQIDAELSISTENGMHLTLLVPKISSST